MDHNRRKTPQWAGNSTRRSSVRFIDCPRQQAAAMLMRAIQGQPYDEIAAALGCTEATARKHVARSRQRLQVLLAHLDPKDAGRSES